MGLANVLPIIFVCRQWTLILVGCDGPSPFLLNASKRWNELYWRQRFPASKQMHGSCWNVIVYLNNLSVEDFATFLFWQIGELDHGQGQMWSKVWVGTFPQDGSVMQGYLMPTPYPRYKLTPGYRNLFIHQGSVYIYQKLQRNPSWTNLLLWC